MSTITTKFPDFAKLYSQGSFTRFNAFYRFKGKTLKVFINLDSVSCQNKAQIFVHVNDEWKFLAELYKIHTPHKSSYKAKNLTEDDVSADIDELFTIAQAVL